MNQAMTKQDIFTFVKTFLEGPGFVGEPEPTRFGVRQSELDTLCQLRDSASGPVSSISDADVFAIYDKHWAEMNGDALPWPISLCLFQYFLRSGRRVISELQSRLQSVTADGLLGDITVAFILNQGDFPGQAMQILASQTEFYGESQDPFVTSNLIALNQRVAQTASECGLSVNNPSAQVADPVVVDQKAEA